MEPVTGTIILLAAIVAAIAAFFSFTNGFNDSANQVAAVITSNSLSAPKALVLAAAGNLVGAAFLGTAVAKTIGQEIVDPSLLGAGSGGELVIVTALLGAICWNLLSWYFAMPSSSSHALIGGLVGAFVAAWGFGPVHWFKLSLIIVIMIVSPLVGFVITYVFTKITARLSAWFTPRVNNYFKKAQVFSLAAQAIAHGTNDGQKTMGVIAFTLVILGVNKVSVGGTIGIPLWVIALCSAAIAAGTVSGGWRIIKTLGAGLYKIRPIHAFASQISSAAVMYLTAFFGYPISTTQVMSSSLVGAGAAFRPKMIRWLVARDMVFAWLITIPVSAAFSAAGLLATRSILGII